VTVWLSPPDEVRNAGLPDVAGLSVRAALRALAACQVAPRIVGSGRVVRQWPEPGARLPLPGPCVLHCAPGRPAAETVVEPGALAQHVPAPPGTPP
jgi:hypothetical protein